MTGLVVLVILTCYLMQVLITHPPKSLEAASRVFTTFLLVIRDIGPAKLKSALTFYQIIMSFPASFDLAPIHFNLNVVMDMFSFFTFDWSEITYPTGCLLGGYVSRLLMVSLTPLVLAIFIPFLLVVLVLVSSFFGAGDDKFDEADDGPGGEGGSDRRSSRGSKTKRRASIGSTMDKLIRLSERVSGPKAIAGAQVSSTGQGGSSIISNIPVETVVGSCSIEAGLKDESFEAGIKINSHKARIKARPHAPGLEFEKAKRHRARYTRRQLREGKGIQLEPTHVGLVPAVCVSHLSLPSERKSHHLLLLGLHAL
eukprot:4301791-Prymnesium_polylepis.5